MDRLQKCRDWVVLTGAGMSAESGIPTFRDAQTGLWAKYRPEELASPEAFAVDPERVWRWYRWRRDKVGEVEPNAGHVALAELEQSLPRLTVITQNVDGLHQAAGSTDVIELHGNIQRSRCSVTGRAIDEDWLANQPGEPPVSPHDPAGYARPDVVWFGETLPEAELNRAMLRARQCDVLLSVGTSALVFPAAGLPRLAASSGALLIEINPEETPLSGHCDASLRARAATALPALRHNIDRSGKT